MITADDLTGVDFTKLQHLRKRNFKTANWELYRKQINIILNENDIFQENNINSIITNLMLTILNAANG